MQARDDRRGLREGRVQSDLRDVGVGEEGGTVEAGMTEHRGYDRERDGDILAWSAKWFLIGLLAVTACFVWAMHVANVRAEESLPSRHQGP